LTGAALAAELHQHVSEALGKILIHALHLTKQTGKRDPERPRELIGIQMPDERIFERRQ